MVSLHAVNAFVRVYQTLLLIALLAPKIGGIRSLEAFLASASVRTLHA